MAAGHSSNDFPDTSYLDPEKQFHLIGWEKQPVMIPRTLIFEADLSITEKMVGVFIHTVLDNRNRGGSFYDWLEDDEANATQFGMSVDEYLAAIRKLHDLGYLTIEGRELPQGKTSREQNEAALAGAGHHFYRSNYLANVEREEFERAEKSRINPRKQVGPSLRLAVYKHDGYQCVACGSNESLTVDHIVPVAHGGTNDRENLQTLCAPCNSSKGTKSMDEWRGGVQ